MNDITKRIRYNRDTRDYDCYVAIDGAEEQYIGSAATYHAGEVKCHEHVMDYFEISHTPETAAALVLAFV